MTEQKDIFLEEEDRSLVTAFNWWEKKRIFFNLLLGLCGIISILLLPSFEVTDLAAAIIYGVLANMFYSLGFFVEIGSRYCFRIDRDLEERRKMLFNTGMAIAMFITLGLALVQNLGHISL